MYVIMNMYYSWSVANGFLNRESTRKLKVKPRCVSFRRVWDLCGVHRSLFFHIQVQIPSPKKFDRQKKFTPEFLEPEERRVFNSL